MKDRRLKQLNTLVLITLGCCIILVALFALILSPKEKKQIGVEALTSMNDRWVLKSIDGQNDRLIELPANLKEAPGETVVLMARVPDDVNESSVLVFETQFQNVMVMVDNYKVYSYGDLENQKLVKNAVPCIHVVPIGSAKKGDILSIYLQSSYKKYSGVIDSIYYGSKNDAYAILIKENGVSFVLGLLLLFVVLLLVIALISIRDIRIDKRKTGYAFGFVFAVAVWSLLNNPIMQLLTGNTYGIYMSSMVLLLFLPMLYFMYQRCFAVKRRYARIFEIGVYVFGINLLTGVVFQLLSVCDFATYMIFTKGLITVGLIILSGIMYLAADTFADRTILSNAWANVVIMIACLLEAGFSLFKFYRNYDGIILQIGIYIFLLLLVAAAVKGVIREMTDREEQALADVEEEKNTLTKQINTKTIFHALNVVVNDLKQTDRENSRLIYDTSVYLKHNLAAMTKQEMVDFSVELEYIKAYLGMESRIHPELLVEVEDKVVEFKVPYHSIEPLVENAVINGALKREQGGRIVVRSYERLDCFAIQIVDNGTGVGPDKAFSGKISYRDIKKRLKNQCGAKVDSNNKPDKGTILTIKIPKAGFVIKE